MDELFDAIKELEKSDVIYAEYLPNDIPIIIKISGLLNDLLIDSEGDCNWENIRIMKYYKYDVFPLERDRFGWLIGAIQTSKGIITYG